MPEITIGTKVRSSARFLRSIGIHTGERCFAVGTVKRFVLLGERTLAQLDWDDPDEIPGNGLTSNLWPVGRLEPA